MSTPELWQVDVPVDDSALRNVSGLFQRAPADEHVHIVIQLTSNGVFRHLPPRILRYLELSTTVLSPQTPQLITLNCWVFADDPDRVFPAKIAREESVGALKKVIKEENPDLGPARTLDLWKVSERIAQRSLPPIHLSGLHSSRGSSCYPARTPRSRRREWRQQTKPYRSNVRSNLGRLPG